MQIFHLISEKFALVIRKEVNMELVNGRAWLLIISILALLLAVGCELREVYLNLDPLLQEKAIEAGKQAQAQAQEKEKGLGIIDASAFTADLPAKSLPEEKPKIDIRIKQ